MTAETRKPGSAPGIDIRDGGPGPGCEDAACVNKPQRLSAATGPRPAIDPYEDYDKLQINKMTWYVSVRKKDGQHRLLADFMSAYRALFDAIKNDPTSWNLQPPNRYRQRPSGQQKPEKP